jgi:hypothetical protein
MWVAVLLAVLPAPIVEGRVGERAGAAAAGAQVTLSQGDRTQVLRADAAGEFRFRAFPGAGTISVVLPQGWTADGPAAARFEAGAGKVIRTDFAARARRILRGRLVFGGAPLADIDVEAGGVRAHSDPQGAFVADGLPAGKVAVRCEWLSGSFEMPPGPADVTAEVPLTAPRLSELRLEKVPQPPAVRPVSAWIEGRPLTEGESRDIDRLAALANLAPGSRLVMVATPSAQSIRAALILRRYLTGPYLVPQERISFAVGEVASPGHLALLLMRPEGE